MDQSLSNVTSEDKGATTANAVDSSKRHCDVHGDFVAKNLVGRIWTRCPACLREQDEASAAEATVRKEREATQERGERLAFHTRNCGLTGRYLNATFDSFDAATTAQKAVKAACQTFVQSLQNGNSGGLWLIGQPGTGKTHMGAAMVRHAIHELGLGAAMHSVPQLMAMLRARWASSNTPVSFWAVNDCLSTTDDLLDFWGRISLLVIDEVGVARGTDHELETLFQIIDKRYSLELPTVLLSNLKPAELKPVLGDRSFDRLREGAKQLVCDWPSHRGSVSKFNKGVNHG
jgi:DNA replication protein DnaC